MFGQKHKNLCNVCCPRHKIKKIKYHPVVNVSVEFVFMVYFQNN